MAFMNNYIPKKKNVNKINIKRKGMNESTRSDSNFRSTNFRSTNFRSTNFRSTNFRSIYVLHTTYLRTVRANHTTTRPYASLWEIWYFLSLPFNCIVYNGEWNERFTLSWEREYSFRVQGINLKGVAQYIST